MEQEPLAVPSPPIPAGSAAGTMVQEDVVREILARLERGEREADRPRAGRGQEDREALAARGGLARAAPAATPAARAVSRVHHPARPGGLQCRRPAPGARDAGPGGSRRRSRDVFGDPVIVTAVLAPTSGRPRREPFRGRPRTFRRHSTLAPAALPCYPRDFSLSPSSRLA